MKPARLTLLLLLSTVVALSASRAAYADPPPSATASSERSVSATATATVRVHSVNRPIRVLGWSKLEVKVSSTTSLPELSTSDDHTRVSVDTHPDDDDPLDVYVPQGARVEVEAVTANVTAKDVNGTVRLSSVNGRVEASGAPREVEVRSVSGPVELRVAGTEARASSVSGEVRVTCSGASRVWAKTVSGPVTVSGVTFARVQVRSVSGKLTLAGGLAGDGPFELRTHSGDIEVTLAKNESPSLDAHTFSGHFDGPPAADAGAPRVVLTLSTFSGDIRVKR